MKVGVCQMPDVPGDATRAVGLMRAWSRDAALHGAALVCFPEGFLQGYDLQPGHIARVAIELASPAFAGILRELEALEPVIVFGMIETDGGRTYNTAVAIERGRIRARYRKAHLLAPEREVFEAGRDCAVFDVGGTRVALNICHDLAHDESVRRASEAGAHLLVCPCNNMLPRSQAEAWKHRHNEIRCRQARDHRLWIAAAEITGERDGCIAYGPTAVIDPGGTVVAQVPLMQIGVVVADIG
ncbi:MAG: carbon-nitrogen hydrolase family protein [Rubrivivax sp.]